MKIMSGNSLNPKVSMKRTKRGRHMVGDGKVEICGLPGYFLGHVNYSWGEELEAG